MPDCITDKCKDPENLANEFKSSLDVSGNKAKLYSRIFSSNLLAEQHGIPTAVSLVKDILSVCCLRYWLRLCMCFFLFFFSTSSVFL